MLIFIYGDNTFLAKEKLEDLKRRFLEKNDQKSFLISTIENNELDLADFRNKVLSSGFFAEKKMVVLKGLQLTAYSLQLLEIIKRIPEETTLVIWLEGEDDKFLKSDLGKYLLKGKYAFKFSSLSGNALISWIRERADYYGCSIDNESAHLISDILGNDLWKIDLELNKICAYTLSCHPEQSQSSPRHPERSPKGGVEGSHPKINRKIVEELLVREAEENIFKFIDALAGKNKRLALMTLQNEFDAGASELAILGMIARQIRILLQTKSLLEKNPRIDKGILAKDLAIHPYVAQKSLGQAKNFHMNELKNIYRQLLQIDMSIKSSSLPARVLFDRMIAKM